MDIGAEISKKIQMAITAKLKELDAYVDDELPDYIMIMVANKKTEQQMTDALSLFLSKNTKTFTSWLHNLLSSLRKGRSHDSKVVKEGLPLDKTDEDESSKANNAAENNSEQPEKGPSKQTAKSKQQSEAVITIDNEMHDLFDEELLAESSAAEVMAGEIQAEVIENTVVEVSTKVSDVESKEKTKSKTSKQSKALKRRSNEQSTSLDSSKTKKERPTKKEKPNKHHKKSKTYKSSQEYSKHSNDTRENKNEKSVREWDRGKGADRDLHTGPRHKVVRQRDESFYSESDSDVETKKKVAVSSAVNQMAYKSEFVSDSESDEDTSKISSRVSYPKRTMRVPLNKQANKALFMKAVSAAEKSVKTVTVAASIKRELSPEAAESLKSSLLRKRVSSTKVKPVIALNDARRKLQIRKAIGKALHSELVGDAKKEKRQLEEQPSDQTAKSKIEASSRLEEPRKKSKLATKSLKIDADVKTKSTSLTYPKTDQRKFIIQSDKTRSNSNSHTVAFDSREALPRHKVDNSKKDEAKPILPSNTPMSNNVNNTAKPAPDFIVTLDGVIRAKHTNRLSEEEKKAARLEKFKSEIAAPLVKKEITAKEENLPAMQELEKMREKIMEVKRESTRLKEMQTKLAAVHAGQNQGSLTSDNAQKSICIANVHYSTTEKQLSDYFSICGKVARTTILRDSVTGHPKGFAYLEFDDTTAVTSALALNNTQLNSRVIRVTIKQPTAPSSYPTQRGIYKTFRGRVTRGAPRFRQSRFARFGSFKPATRNKTWVNPALSETGR